jgi:hypothetical protein
MAVAIVPGLLVSIAAARRDELIQNGRQVALQARLEFDGADGPGASHVEHVHVAGSNARRLDGSRHTRRKVMHVAVPARLDGDLLLMGHSLTSPMK